MKTRTLAFLLLLSALALAGQASATYRPSYASYNAVSVGGDGQTVYSTVTLQGTTTGDCSSGSGTIPGCSGALHTPKIYNQVGTAGGWNIGQTVSMWTYINFQNTTSFVAATGVQYQHRTFSMVSCTAGGGAFFGPFFDQFFLRAETLLRYTGTTKECRQKGTVLVCDYSVVFNGTAETSPPTWNPPWVTDSPPPFAGWLASALCFRVLSSQPWECGLLPDWALKTTQTTPRACTKAN